MLRAVLDTNVYVAGLLSSRGAPAAILRSLTDGAFDAIVCPALLSELRGVLARPKIAGRIDPETAEMFLAWLERVAVDFPDPQAAERVSPDPSDDYLVALARDAEATFLVSGDAHLLDIGLRQPAAVSPATFATMLDALER